MLCLGVPNFRPPPDFHGHRLEARLKTFFKSFISALGSLALALTPAQAGSLQSKDDGEQKQPKLPHRSRVGPVGTAGTSSYCIFDNYMALNKVRGAYIGRCPHVLPCAHLWQPKLYIAAPGKHNIVLSVLCSSEALFAPDRLQERVLAGWAPLSRRRPLYTALWRTGTDDYCSTPFI